MNVSVLKRWRSRFIILLLSPLTSYFIFMWVRTKQPPCSRALWFNSSSENCGFVAAEPRVMASFKRKQLWNPSLLRGVAAAAQVQSESLETPLHPGALVFFSAGGIWSWAVIMTDAWTPLSELFMRLHRWSTGPTTANSWGLRPRLNDPTNELPPKVCVCTWVHSSLRTRRSAAENSLWPSGS